jgi:hypothetical protein
MTRDLEAILAPHVRHGETPLDVVQRLIAERNGFAVAAAKNQAMVDTLLEEKGAVVEALNNAGAHRERSSAEDQGTKPRTVLEQVKMLVARAKK